MASLGHNVLTLWVLNYVDTILQSAFSVIFLSEYLHILIKISLKYVPKGPINNMQSLVQEMAWCWIGDKPFSEPMIT